MSTHIDRMPRMELMGRLLRGEDVRTDGANRANITAEWETLHHSALIWSYEKATGMTLVWSADFEELSAAWHKKKAFLSKKIATRDE